MRDSLPFLIWLAGWGQLSVLIASALVPFKLNWKGELAGLPQLLRQLFWVYGGYTVMTIIALGTICIVNANELAAGSALARSFCLFAATFWGVRLSLQTVLNARPYLTESWLWAGEAILTIWFAAFTAVFAWSSLS